MAPEPMDGMQPEDVIRLFVPQGDDNDLASLLIPDRDDDWDLDDVIFLTGE